MPVRPFDIEQIRADFPILGRKVYDKYPLVYLDNAATTQKPRLVVESMVDEYYNVNANVHRGVHFLSQQATDLHEQARETVRRFIGAGSTREILFTRGTTESIHARGRRGDSEPDGASQQHRPLAAPAGEAGHTHPRDTHDR